MRPQFPTLIIEYGLATALLGWLAMHAGSLLAQNITARLDVVTGLLK